MKQNQKPVTPLNPQLAALIGDFVVSQQDKAFFIRLKYALSGSFKRRLLTGFAVLALTTFSVLSFIAHGTSLNLTNVKAAQTSLNINESDAELRAQIRSKAESYAFAITYPDARTKQFKLADSGIRINDEASVSQVRQEVRMLGWQRFAWWRTTEVPLVISKDNKKFEAFAAANIAVANQPAKDASLGVASGKAVITAATDGSTYQIPNGNKRLIAASKSLQPLFAKLEPTITKPSIKSDDLKLAADKINAITNHSVSFIIGERTIAVTPTEIGNWLDIQAIPAEKTADVTVNSGKVQAYVDKISASSIYTSKAQISVTDASGAVTILSPGRIGSAVANKTTVVKNVSNQLMQPDSVISANLEIKQDAFKSINAADYPKWLVADVSAKRMYAYEHNRLVRSFAISAGAPKTPTVLGTYKIYRKVPLRTMRGANADGSRYVQPDVKYVNYFHTDYAIHGNYWRPASVFGNVNTSHGCVGITDSDAEWIYNWAPIGTTVITHN